MNLIKNKLQLVVKELFNEEVEIELTRPEEQFGDYSTNVALQLSKKLGKNPREIAQQIADHPDSQGRTLEIAGPGFINVTLSDEELVKLAQRQPEKTLEGKTFVVEYSCPNAFKELHTGHLYNTIAGDIIARLVERAGATTNRTSFGGDVGLHVAKCLWGIIEELGIENADRLENSVSKDPLERAAWISERYVAGATAYEEDESAKHKIIELNKAVYDIHAEQDVESNLAKIYWTCRQWSFDYFDALYELIKVDKMRYYPESETTERGLALVREQLSKGNLEESDGAVVFRGDEAQNLHTRVFITSKGLPTYETKDIGVILAEQEEYNFDRRILLTGNDQAAYMQVVFAAMDVFQPGMAAKMTHLTNGTVRFGDGKKMSSRLGNVSRAVDVVSAVRARVAEIAGGDEELQEQITLGAIKYEFAKYRLGGDVAFDIEESVSLKGNSGPYLQYAFARANSILNKSTVNRHPEPVSGSDHGNSEILKQVQDDTQHGLVPAERSLLRKIGEYAEVVEKATQELMPHHICTYLYELAQVFNRFYEHNRVIGDPREALRIQLVSSYASTLKNGLELLGIHAPRKM